MKTIVSLAGMIAVIAFLGIPIYADTSFTERYESARKAAEIPKPLAFQAELQLEWESPSTGFFQMPAKNGKSVRMKFDASTGKVNACSESEIGAGPEMTTLGKSYSSSDVRVSVTFKNASDKDLNLFWVDSNGKRKPYGSMKPGGLINQSTFAGHVFLFCAGKEDWAAYRMQEGVTQIVVSDKKLKARPREAGHQKHNKQPARQSFIEVIIQDHNVYFKNKADDVKRQITSDGTQANGYINHVEWSPDLKHVMVMRERPGGDRKLTVINSVPKNKTQPEVITVDYLKPGDEIQRLRPCLFTAEGKQLQVSDALYSNPWGINHCEWTPDSSAFRFLYNQRGHQVARLVELGTNGTTRTVIDEVPPTFFCYSSKEYINRNPDADEYLWMSERDGWNHLYLYDGKTGKVKNQVTKGEWVVRNVEEVDWDANKLYFYASGVIKGQDPYYLHYCSINLDGSHFKILTEGDGCHTVQLSPEKKYFLDTWSRVDLPYQFELRERETGKRVCMLLENRAPNSDYPLPERFVAKGRDGETDIYGIFYRPRSFVPGKRYPVIENIYAGPHGAFVAKVWNAGQSVRNQTFANLGFIVVSIDGMGTNWRSKKFHDVAWKNIADAGFPDRIAWMKALAKKYPCIDISRVGIYGGSAGGQSTMGALLFHGDFYKVGVADCGCHDNRMDKIWWNEQWMGWPVGKHYAEQSNRENAAKLTGKLMLTVGEIDTNVDPSSTFQVADALIKAGKDFELVVIPGGGHGSGEVPWAAKKRAAFFVQHLQ
ncbi:MAG: prolyl oligopeptidase family serine peptidase [bacterium]